MTGATPMESDDFTFVPDRKVAAALRGALAGTAATLPMSLLMLSAQKAGLMGKHPPERITEWFLKRADLRRTPEEAENILATVNHFAFGAVAGALYGLVRREQVPEVVQGTLFGLGVWTCSYKGWVPALGIMPPAEHDRPGRPASMIAAHLVFGASLGALYKGFRGS